MTWLQVAGIACLVASVGLAVQWRAEARATAKLASAAVVINGVEVDGARLLAHASSLSCLCLELDGPSLCQAYLRSSKIKGGDEAVLPASLDILMDHVDEHVDDGGLVLTTRPWRGPGSPRVFRLTVDSVNPDDKARRWEADSLAGVITYAAMDVDRARLIAERNLKELERAD